VWQLQALERSHGRLHGTTLAALVLQGGQQADSPYSGFLDLRSQSFCLRDDLFNAAASHRVLRGGGWSLGASSCRAARRNWHDPSFRSPALGFRLAAVPSGLVK